MSLRATTVALVSVTAAVLLSHAVGDAQSVYRWVDKDGNVHYSQTPYGDLKRRGWKPS